jgi:hypothetical protein
MKIQLIALVSLFSVMGCGEEEAVTSTSSTLTTETGTTTTTETGTTTTTETGTTTTTETGTTMTTETGTTTTTSMFSPVEGVWRVMAMTMGKNDCGLASDEVLPDDPAAFGVRNIDASSFLLKSMEDLDIHFKCTNTEALKAYTCTSVVMSDPVKSLDAVLNSAITPEVLFSGGITAEMPFDFTVECVGADCPKVSAASGKVFPCLAEVVLSLELGGS